MILGIGTDIIEIKRLQEAMDRHPETFLARTFTPAELEIATTRKMSAMAFYAGRWAAKEALAKALGTGFSKECSWLDINIGNDERGKPYVELSGITSESAQSYGIKSWHLSISHEQNYATAMIVAES
ncbi:MAG: holo-ACP synthase [Lentisphaeria bacterium]|nr:holo-ACP synthase [Lentisphaeria bacterium]NQZ69051.1 holo-ACP synthase [Lentisphaeria bacterium]